MGSIHPTAIISPKAEIDEGVDIGPYAVIGDKVKVKAGTSIEAHTVIDGDTYIGKGNEIFPFASIGLKPQDLKYNNEDTKLIIGNNNKIREFTTIHKGTIEANETRIGDNNLFMAYAHVAHDCKIGNNCILANCATLAGHVVLGDYITIGGLTGVHQFVSIGSHSFIGGASKITQNVLPYLMVSGNESSVHGLNIVGLKRRNYTSEQIAVLKDAYKTIFKSNYRLEEALEILSEKYKDSKDIKCIVEFAKKMERGICR